MEKKSVAVTLEHVTKRFRDLKGGNEVIAVNDSNFVIQPGELVTLLGPSGCGKTTTLRMVGGFELPTEGKIFIGDEDVTMLPPNKRDTATMFQSYGLFPHMTVFDNVAYGLKLRKVPQTEIKTRVEEMLEMVGLGGYGDRAPSKLSGGQQQRVALARSLIVTPSVLLLDEPLSNLDALLREQMRVEIRRIQKKLGITAIYVTHDRIEAMSLSDRVVVMKSGVIRQIGTPTDIYEKPKNRFIAGFVGKVTFFPVHVLEHSGEAWCVQLGGKKTTVSSAGENVNMGDEAVLMARPESLRLTDAHTGNIEATVKMNVYLGNTLECYLHTDFGEVLVQVDDPHSKKTYQEGEACSIDFSPDRVRLLNANPE